jgi:hypothetical protein
MSSVVSKHSLYTPSYSQTPPMHNLLDSHDKQPQPPELFLTPPLKKPPSLEAIILIPNTKIAEKSSAPRNFSKSPGVVVMAI